MGGEKKESKINIKQSLGKKKDYKIKMMFICRVILFKTLTYISTYIT